MKKNGSSYPLSYNVSLFSLKNSINNNTSNNKNIPQMSDVSLSLAKINPQTDTVKISLYADIESLLYCKVYNKNNRLVATAANGSKLKNAGKWYVNWKGKDGNGKDLKTGKYRIDAYLCYNQISNIDALSGLKNLRILKIGGNKITNVQALRNLTNLESLYLGVHYAAGGNNVSDISSLSGLTNLIELGLYGNDNIKSIDALRGMTKLTYLNLRGLHISNIDVLRGMRNLRYLNIGTSNSKIRDISALKDCTELIVFLVWSL